MAIGLENFPNISAPDSNYPNGNIKDNPGDNSGTPLNKFVHADYHQFFRKLLSLASITPNGLVENVTNGYQYITALIAKIRATLATETDAGTAEIATQIETNTGSDDARMITPLKLNNRTATETRTGIAEIATTAETLTGTDNARMITPLKLAQRIVDESWRSVGAGGQPAFQNSWQNSASPSDSVCRFMIEKNGFVNIIGFVFLGASGTTVFTLPAGYRPTKLMWFPLASDGTSGYIVVQADGQVKIVYTGGTAYSFTGCVRFPIV